MDKHDTYLTMRLKIESVFEHYAEQSKYYKRATIAQRFEMEDAFYRLSMELLAKIIGPFEPTRGEDGLSRCARNDRCQSNANFALSCTINCVSPFLEL